MFRKIPSLKFLYEIDENGTLRNTKSKKIRKPYKVKQSKEKERLAITIYNNTTKKRDHYYIHRLVAECWLPNWDPNLTVDHIDSNPLNNNYKNLQMLSDRDNRKKAIDDGLLKGKTGFIYYGIHKSTNDKTPEFTGSHEAARWIIETQEIKAAECTVSSNIREIFSSNGYKGLRYNYKWYRYKKQ